ncbi:hypothetical protein FRB94_003298 [Tulasnella sp. JGI-2019a]|nr:hypothetical protein FRB94_003298 [Tulasnella sp. JGI-2019a]
MRGPGDSAPATDYRAPEARHSTFKTLLIVLDAIDECQKQGAKELLRLLLSEVSKAPFPLKVFMTSRPEPHLRSIFNHADNIHKLILHDIEASVVKNDIRLYLQTSFAEIPSRLGLSIGRRWARHDEIEALVERAETLFIVAATFARFAGDEEVKNPRQQLNLLLQRSESSFIGPNHTIDELYLQILRKIRSTTGSSHIIERLQQMVGAIVLLRNPMSVAAMERLLGLSVGDGSRALHHLHSVISIPRSPNGCPRIHHTSFPDFITDPLRCTESEFCIQKDVHEARLAARCLGLMIFTIESRVMKQRVEQLRKLGWQWHEPQPRLDTKAEERMRKEREKAEREELEEFWTPRPLPLCRKLQQKWEEAEWTEQEGGWQRPQAQSQRLQQERLTQAQKARQSQQERRKWLPNPMPTEWLGREWEEQHAWQGHHARQEWERQQRRDQQQERQARLAQVQKGQQEQKERLVQLAQARMKLHERQEQQDRERRPPWPAQKAWQRQEQQEQHAWQKRQARQEQWEWKQRPGQRERKDQQDQQEDQQERQERQARQERQERHKRHDQRLQEQQERQERQERQAQQELELEELVYALSSWSYHSSQAGRGPYNSEVADLLGLSISRYLMWWFEAIRRREPITCLTEESSWAILCRAKDLASMFAAVALDAGDPQKAVEVVEHVHNTSVVQLAQYRTALDKLHASSPELLSELLDLSSQLQRANSEKRDTVGGKGALWLDTVRSHCNLSKHWNDVLARIRKLPGFEVFLKPTPFKTLQYAAAQGPVIIVNVTHVRSDAIIILKSGEPAVIPLPKARPDAIKSLLETPMRGTTKWPALSGSPPPLRAKLQYIWTVIVAPVVNYLERTLRLPHRSRVWWNPTVAVWSLPLHAAQPFISHELSLPDRFVSSYTPSLSALLRSDAPAVRTFDPDLLLMAPSANHVGVHGIITTRPPARVTVIGGVDSTKETMLAGLKDSAWVHITSDSYWLANDSFNSTILLPSQDIKPLTLLDINRNNFPRAEMAFLSVGHSAHGDEASNLAAGMLLSGFRSVVGSMWEISDEDRLIVARAFYKYMFRNGPEAADYRDAAMALSMATKDLIRKGVPLERWVNLVHYGM